MREVVVSSEDTEVLREIEGEKERESCGRKDGLVRWERFLPKIALRVLLVEADDSTRQIVGALLRKCSYRVAAVPDGLKAWEMLKGRPHDIDLILTEVDLPSISGYALLTLIMEHEICKNIPVIMMSSHDSVSMVYKCMLKGAADYLVKPLRRNELRNLWQHVWRRQSSLAAENLPQDESVGQQKLEATSDNNSSSNSSSGFAACVQKNKEQIEKGSAQSSCTKPDLEAEGADDENNVQQLLVQKQGKSLLDDTEVQNADFPQLPEHMTGLGVMHHGARDNFEPENPKVASVTDAADDAPKNSSRLAIDFMGAIRKNYSATNEGTSKFDRLLELDLSLRRSHPSGFENQSSREKLVLQHSNASAFTRYVNRPLQRQCSFSPCVSDQRKEVGTSHGKNSSDAAGYNHSNSPGPPPPSITPRRELATPWLQQSSYPTPIPVKRVKFSNNPNAGYGSGIPSIFTTQSSPSPTPSPGSISPQEFTSLLHPFHLSSLEHNKSEQFRGQLVNNRIENSYNHPMYKFDSTSDRELVSPATEQSRISSVGDGVVSHLNNMHYGSASGSNSNVDQVPDVSGPAENKNEDGFSTLTGNSKRSLQRELALMKFRLKRKERCFEKKVRYESRKKLAEQRPRVKGQFVRQVHGDPAPPAPAPTLGTQGDSGNSSDCKPLSF